MAAATAASASPGDGDGPDHVSSLPSEMIAAIVESMSVSSLIAYAGTNKAIRRAVLAHLPSSKPRIPICHTPWIYSDKIVDFKNDQRIVQQHLQLLTSLARAGFVTVRQSNRQSMLRPFEAIFKEAHGRPVHYVKLDLQNDRDCWPLEHIVARVEEGVRITHLLLDYLFFVLTDAARTRLHKSIRDADVQEITFVPSNYYGMQHYNRFLHLAPPDISAIHTTEHAMDWMSVPHDWITHSGYVVHLLEGAFPLRIGSGGDFQAFLADPIVVRGFEEYRAKHGKPPGEIVPIPKVHYNGFLQGPDGLYDQRFPIGTICVQRAEQLGDFTSAPPLKIITRKMDTVVSVEALAETRTELEVWPAWFDPLEWGHEAVICSDTLGLNVKLGRAEHPNEETLRAGFTTIKERAIPGRPIRRVILAMGTARNPTHERTVRRAKLFAAFFSAMKVLTPELEEIDIVDSEIYSRRGNARNFEGSKIAKALEGLLSHAPGLIVKSTRRSVLYDLVPNHKDRFRLSSTFNVDPTKKA